MGNCKSAEIVSDPDSQYDSTWDNHPDSEPSSQKKLLKQPNKSARRNMNAARNMNAYRHKCHNIQDADSSKDHEGDLYNLEFYQNKRPSLPDQLFIEDFHNQWFGNYNKLENMHSYIQWWFPIQEQGMNNAAHILTVREIKFFRNDEVAKRRLLKSYVIMLDFYGIKLLDEAKGSVGRAENWKERFRNLNRNSHNNLRITRILKCLGILGFQHYQAPLVHFFLQETLVKGTLPRVKQSVLDYFMFAVLDKSERKKLIRFAFRHFEPKAEFVWCPQKIQKRFLREMKRKKKSSLCVQNSKIKKEGCK